jgi:hypothetical protein
MFSTSTLNGRLADVASSCNLADAEALLEERVDTVIQVGGKLAHCEKNKLKNALRCSKRMVLYGHTIFSFKIWRATVGFSA